MFAPAEGQLLFVIVGDGDIAFSDETFGEDGAVDLVLPLVAGHLAGLCQRVVHQRLIAGERLQHVHAVSNRRHRPIAAE